MHFVNTFDVNIKQHC